MQDEETLERARAGDGQAFRKLTEPYRRELQVHCYRILGSVQDAEDLLQETLLAAWRGLEGFEGRSSLRSWLYRIATNRCLNALRDSTRRSREQPAYRLEIPLPEPTRRSDPSWLEPYPDVLLDELPDHAPGPEARYETKESVSLAFLVALQQLPPRQRAVLVLRDVLGFRAAEVAGMLDTTVDSVTSALKRARATLATRLPEGDRDDTAPPYSPRERKLVDDFARAFERADVDAILALLTDDVWLTMPPLPFEYQGLGAVGHFLSTIAMRDDRRFRLVPTHANGQPAFGCYLLDPRTPIAHAHGLLVLTVSGNGISSLTRFVDNSLLPGFGLPRTLGG
ncbi:sigma-70 family RNA polymerase sigma factor [Streptomyces sp. NBC_00287]|uniref:sigma-70 family RNA polymerase sigma factor n=1 Tax=Streptomyces sp. NBC_00287 TaxID=2975702 RepID=UPI002E27AC76|nr:sigma-70 family RNA polymerase sigma factor [Streptomyces sp. NBC_00287]